MHTRSMAKAKQPLTVGDLKRLLETADDAAEVWGISQYGVFYEISRVQLDTNPVFMRTNHLIQKLRTQWAKGDVFYPRTRLKGLEAGKFIILAGGPEGIPKGHIDGIPSWDEL